MIVWSLFIIDLMGLFFYTKIGSIISIGDLPTTNIIEPFFVEKILSFYSQDLLHLTIVVAVELVDFVVLVVLVGQLDQFVLDLDQLLERYWIVD